MTKVRWKRGIARIAVQLKIANGELEEEKDKSEFFNLPGAQADLSRWKRKKHWHPEEAVALSLGKNPKIVTLETLTQLRRPTSSCVSEFRARMDTLQRAISAGHISTPLTPKAFIAWADNEGILLPSELNATQRTDPSEETAKDEDINPKTQDTFFKILVGMAIKHYAFDPNWDPKEGDKSDVFSKMMHDLDGLNLRVDIKTLRTHMDKALKRTAELGLVRKKSRETGRSVNPEEAYSFTEVDERDWRSF